MARRPQPGQVPPLAVDPRLGERLPGLGLVVVEVAGLDNHQPTPVIAEALAERQGLLRAQWPYSSAAAHPHLAAWRETMRAIGVKPGKKLSSIESLVRRAVSDRPLTSINPLVDLYHLVSLRHLLPAGGWDAESLPGRLTLRFTRGGERFLALGAEREETVAADELAYVAAPAQVVTRHFVWRQSEHGKITADTRHAILVAEVLAGRAPNLASRVRDAFCTLLLEHFGVTARTWILRA